MINMRLLRTNSLICEIANLGSGMVSYFYNDDLIVLSAIYLGRTNFSRVANYAG